MEEASRNWYALKIFYNRVFDMERLLAETGISSYIAANKVELEGSKYLSARRRLALMEEKGQTDTRFVREGLTLYRRVPMVSSLMFFHAPQEQIKQVEGFLYDPEGFLPPKGFIYKTPDWHSYAVIPPRQMEIFRLVTESGDTGLEFFSDDATTHYKKGDKVRVTDGPLKGAEGYIKRIRKDRRLLVCIEGIIAVATSYIPPENLEIIKEE